MKPALWFSKDNEDQDIGFLSMEEANDRLICSVDNRHDNELE